MATRAAKPRLTEDNTRYARIVGRNIAILRRQANLTQGDLAKKMTAAGHRMGTSTVGFIELARISSGQPRALSVDQLVALADFFGCTPADLLTPACETCEGAPPDGFTCNACGRGSPDTPA
jgi:transcriptional regulator with XRE-family HTH domain